jgi:hypothetical protein
MIEFLLAKLIGFFFLILSVFFFRISITWKGDSNKIDNIRLFGSGLFSMLLSIGFLFYKVSFCELLGFFCK